MLPKAAFSIGASRIAWQESRAAYPEGVASADPDRTSVLLWTRQKVVATSTAQISKESDWTCRVLVGGLKPAHVYWYRFTDREGAGSRIGRTITAPSPDDPMPVSFVFVSCQNANDGAQTTYHRLKGLRKNRLQAEAPAPPACKAFRDNVGQTLPLPSANPAIPLFGENDGINRSGGKVGSK